jgi:dienelactone hydrolase
MLDGRPMVVTGIAFARMPLDMVTVCDGNDRITMLRFQPPAQVELAARSAPLAPVKAHVEADGTRVLPLIVASPAGPLQGALTLPPGKGPFPAIVMVAGSGPQDRDETIGPNKPFQQLAEGLARAGVASLRYDKRTYTYGKTWGDKQGNVVDAEVTTDALAAARLLAGQPSIDPRRVFVLGHSLGAMMAPRIATRDADLAGLVMLAAPSRPLLSVLEQQMREAGRKSGASEAVLAQQAQAFEQERKALAKAGSGPAPTGSFVNIPQTYWLSLHGDEQVRLARSLSVPMLVMQGNSDFQVSPRLDFAGWRRELSGHPGVTFRDYPGLSHLFMPAGKTGSVADYLAPGRIPGNVITDIADWVKAQPARSGATRTGAH